MQITFEKDEIDSNLPWVKNVLSAIASMHSCDELVTYALRRNSYGSDGWSVTYASDQDFLDDGVIKIPEGYIEVCCIGCGDETGPLVEEVDYVKILSKVCKFSGLHDRAELLLEYCKSPSITDYLLEADVKRCNERWKLFAPFLLNNGWVTDGTNIVYPTSKVSFNFAQSNSDLNVIYRDTKRNLIKNIGARKDWLDHQKSLLVALEDFFEYESTKI